MSQPEASSSAAAAAAADSQTPKVKAQQAVGAVQQDKAAENRAKAQQNRERAAQNRAQKNDRFNKDRASSSSSKPSTSSSASAGKQPKKAAKKDTPAKNANAARQGQAKPQTQFKSKVVIRRLPPNLPEEVFWKAVSPWIRDFADCQAAASTAGATAGSEGPCEASTATTPTPTVDYKSFIPGKLKSDLNKQNKHSRAYVRFLDPTSLVTFHKNFDGHIFRDAKGKESVAIVEFAPYQKVVLSPSTAAEQRRRGGRNKPDPKQGTIEKDADYLAFVERLNKVEDGGAKRSDGDLLAGLWDPKEKIREKEEQVEKGKMTPLLEHLRAVKLAKKESAAAAKKANRAAKKGAAKATGKEVVPVSGKGKAVEAAIGAGQGEQGPKAGKKENKKKLSKGKGAAPGSSGGGVDATASAEGGKKPGQASKQPAQGSVAKQPKLPKKTLDAANAGATKSNSTPAQGAKSKPKAPPCSQRKKPSLKTQSTNPTPGKVQILKRDP